MAEDLKAVAMGVVAVIMSASDPKRTFNVMLSGAQRPRAQEPMKHRRMQMRHRFQRVRSN